MQFPNLQHEIELWKKGFTVIGIDEVGRGSFAGPLHVGGVIFSPTRNKNRITKLLSYGINDSKKLKAPQRKALSEIIQKECLSYYISQISVTLINRIGIGKATSMAMRDVVKNLCQTLNVKGQMSKPFVLVDGFYIKHLKNIGLKNQKAIIRGDGISLSIAAASIIAKVARDAYMIKLSNKHPEYAWERNKGYGTLEHRIALGSFGGTKLHRTDFVTNFIPKIA